MRALDALIRRPVVEVQRYVPPAWLSDQVNSPPPGYVTTWGSDRAEPIGNTFVDYASAGLMGNTVVAAVERVRLAVFSEARFQFQRFFKGRPAGLFGLTGAGLELLERPWTGGTTGDLLVRMLLDADLAGNWFGTLLDGDLVRLRPDWTEIVLAPRFDMEGRQVGVRRLGYLYYEAGKLAGHEPAVFLLDEVAHFAPLPDPLAAYRGMSWLTPVVREVQADTMATRHKLKFFENAAPQPLDAAILTPGGWATMGSLEAGGRVIGSDGKPHEILGVFPQGERDIYRVEFSSGGSTECTLDHLWTVASTYDRKLGTGRTMTLGQMMHRGIRYRSGPAKWSVPLVDPVEFDDPGPLPLDPYLLGSLLGDGSFRSNGRGSGGVSLACAAADADEQRDLLVPLLPADVTVSRRDRGGWAEFYFKGPGGTRPNPLTSAIRQLGLFDKLGFEKAVPPAYLRAAVTQRIAILQGLLDTDGNVDRRQPNTARFDSTSEQLARDVADLVGGLGGLATARPGRPGRPGGRAQWRVTVSRLPEWIIPFRLARKAGLYDPRCDGRWRYIRSVELVGRKPAQCIAVDSADHLYVTDAHILTHNTPNLAVSLPKEIDPQAFAAFVDAMDAKHKGAENAYKTLYTGGGADVTVIGADMRQLDFKTTQGTGETRICSAGGVHPAIAALSEGLQGASLNSGNFTAARRLVADGTMRPLWRNAAGSLEVLVPPPGTDSRLWYDARDVSFLREDAKDAAEITQIEATTIAALVKEGFTPESAKAAVIGQNMDLLVHTGMVSVQLQPPGTAVPDSPAVPPEPAFNGTPGG